MTKRNMGRKGFASPPHHSPSPKEVGAGTPGRNGNREHRGVLLPGSLFKAYSACFLTCSPAQGWHTPRWTVSSYINQENGPQASLQAIRWWHLLSCGCFFLDNPRLCYVDKKLIITNIHSLLGNFLKTIIMRLPYDTHESLAWPGLEMMKQTLRSPSSKPCPGAGANNKGLPTKIIAM